jgi:hypothetical protein
MRTRVIPTAQDPSEEKHMAVLTVGPSSTYPTIAGAMLVASDNDTIALQSGYGGEHATVTHTGMTISGDSSSTGIVLALGTALRPSPLRAQRLSTFWTLRTVTALSVTPAITSSRLRTAPTRSLVGWASTD